MNNLFDPMKMISMNGYYDDPNAAYRVMVVSQDFYDRLKVKDTNVIYCTTDTNRYYLNGVDISNNQTQPENTIYMKMNNGIGGEPKFEIMLYSHNAMIPICSFNDAQAAIDYMIIHGRQFGTSQEQIHDIGIQLQRFYSEYGLYNNSQGFRNLKKYVLNIISIILDKAQGEIVQSSLSKIFTEIPEANNPIKISSEHPLYTRLSKNINYSFYRFVYVFIYTKFSIEIPLKQPKDITENYFMDLAYRLFKAFQDKFYFKTP